jgi:hypothetical protein
MKKIFTDVESKFGMLTVTKSSTPSTSKRTKDTCRSSDQFQNSKMYFYSMETPLSTASLEKRENITIEIPIQINLTSRELGMGTVPQTTTRFSF